MPISLFETRMRKMFLNLFAILIILLMLTIAIQVISSWLGVNPLVKFQKSLLLFGKSITTNSLTELQWHLLVLVGLLPCALVWRMNGHVRVDFLYAKYGSKYRSRVDFLGNVFLTLPFLALCLPASWRFAVRAWRIAETSSNAGLIDRFLVKGILPLGFFILAVIVLLELPQLFRQAFLEDAK